MPDARHRVHWLIGLWHPALTNQTVSLDIDQMSLIWVTTCSHGQSMLFPFSLLCPYECQPSCDNDFVSR